MPTFSNIDGEEPSTITFSVGTVSIARGSTTEKQEILCLGDPDTSNALAAITAAAPDSTRWGLNVRIVSGPSSVADFAVRSVLSSTSADNPVRAVLSSTNTDNPVRAVLSSTGADNPISGVVRTTNATASDLQVTATPVAGSTWAVRPLQSSAADLQVTATPVAGSTWNVRPLQSSAADLQMTATPAAGSTWAVRPLQSSAADLQMTATPAAGSTWAVRPLQSSAADLQVTATPAAGSTWPTRPLQSSQADLRATVYQSTASEFKAQSWTFDSTGGGVIGSTAPPAAGINGLSVRQVYAALLSTTTLITSTHSTALYSLISSAAAIRQKVYAYFVSSTHTNPSTLVFMSSNAIDRWHVGFGSGSSGMTGANMALSPPGWIFHTDAANALNVRIEGGSSITATVVARISIGYFSEA